MVVASDVVDAAPDDSKKTEEASDEDSSTDRFFD